MYQDICLIVISIWKKVHPENNTSFEITTIEVHFKKLSSYVTLVYMHGYLFFSTITLTFYNILTLNVTEDEFTLSSQVHITCISRILINHRFMLGIIDPKVLQFCKM